ncbi:N,N-dimethylformamidase beta subunit family domain-containing protein [Alloactinosynnema sp. L-07]|uniref:N,N-dimethylformamidase beta subunit family domain-containing protein n=1 Tax=Alloactinosynnema sp. L-07 TaxID=1653480 RepID=UPI0012F94B76|nr:N,N-dimethylformamidase beta subunit family domain-containing protein [Alloactinosynnema sp. L-07]
MIVRRAALVAVLALVGGCQSDPPPPGVPSSVPPPAVTTTSAVPGAEPGTPGWQVTRPGLPHEIEGFADRVSALPGEDVRLFVSTTAGEYTVTAYRMGAYQGSDARQVWQSGVLPGVQQPPRVIEAPTNTVVAPWAPSLTLSTGTWPAGDYLLRLDTGSGSAQQFVPLTLRTASNKGRVVVVNAVTTWQAYNRWGGYSLYEAPDGKRANRSRAVSFDRPYQAAVMHGAGDFLFFELPFLTFAERLGIDLGYATDVDLHADPSLLDGARAVVTLGHDEYWSTAMRAHVTAARDAGTNLAFLGGNEIFRHIRLAPTANGPNRLEIGYKSFADDPMSKTDPTEATQDWRFPPHPRPESVLLGNIYQCNPVSADLVVADESSWLLTGIVHKGQKLPGLVGNEYANVDLRYPTPRPIQVLFRSPVTCRGKADFADATYYSTASGAGVFSAGTQYWICALSAQCGHSGGDPVAHQAISAITERMLRAFAAGPAGATHPAVDNLAALGIAGG